MSIKEKVNYQVIRSKQMDLHGLRGPAAQHAIAGIYGEVLLAKICGSNIFRRGL
jgi:hypothetical protein